MVPRNVSYCHSETKQNKTRGVITPQQRKYPRERFIVKTAIKIKDLKGPNGGIMFGTVEALPGQYPVKELIFHQGGHWDEVVADRVIRHKGSAFFPGIDDAQARFLSREELAKADALAYLKEGSLIVGASDSPFNEHETASRGEVIHQCAATVAAGLLGASEAAEFRNLLYDAKMIDRYPNEYGGNVTGHVANIMKAMLESGLGDEKVFAWGQEAAEAILIRQLNFWHGAAESWNDVATVFTHRLGNGCPIRVAVIRADDEVYTRYAFSSKGPRADMVLAFNSRGQMYLGTQKDAISLKVIREVFRLIAIQDMEMRKQNVPWEYLQQGAELPDDVGHLHLWREACGILNKGEPVSLLPERVVALVKLGLCYRPKEHKKGDNRHQHGKPTAPLKVQTQKPVLEMKPKTLRAVAVATKVLEKVFEKPFIAPAPIAPAPLPKPTEKPAKVEKKVKPMPPVDVKELELTAPAVFANTLNAAALDVAFRTPPQA